MEKQGLGFEITELRLGLPGGSQKNEKKRLFSDLTRDRNGDFGNQKLMEKKNIDQVVGWPPVCSYRRKSCFNGLEVMKMYVKVSMDGAPFLRKMDLSAQRGYDDLGVALEKLFGCFGIGKTLKVEDNCEYVPIYEDKDGDWMLVGDVPWEMFTESCKRLRIMKGSEAKCIGLHAKSSLTKNL